MPKILALESHPRDVCDIGLTSIVKCVRHQTPALFAAVLVGSWGTASAVTLRIDAVSTDPNGVGFDVVFEDTGDGLLQYEEVLSSSGILFPDGGSFPRLFGVPDLEGISTIGGPCGEPDRWCFFNSEEGLSVSIDETDFTYSIGPVAVDEPASLTLLVIALGVLGVRLRRTIRA